MRFIQADIHTTQQAFPMVERERGTRPPTAACEARNQARNRRLVNSADGFGYVHCI